MALDEPGKFLDILTGCFFGGECLSVQMQATGKLTNVDIDNGMVDISALAGLSPGFGVLARRLGGKEKDAEVPLRSFAAVLLDAFFRPSRIKSLTPAACAFAFRSLCLAFGTLVDSSVGDSIWNESCLSLAPRGGPKRSRRVSAAFKEALIQEVARAPELGGIGCYLAAQKRSKTDAGASSTYSEKNSQKIMKDGQLQYLRSQRLALKNCSTIHVSMDALRVGGDETMVFLNTFPELGLMTWSPPQACLVLSSEKNPDDADFCQTVTFGVLGGGVEP